VGYKFLKKYNCSNDSWNEYKLGKKPSSPYYSEIIGSNADFSLNGNEYVITCMGKRKTLSNQLWEFNPHTMEWILKNNLPPLANDSAICFSVGEKIFAIRGKNNLLEYNFSSDSWSEIKGALPQKYFTSSFVANEKAYFISQHELWEYIP
jgi:hypothetical protein